VVQSEAMLLTAAKKLTLAVLGRFTGLVQADFLAFHFAGVAGHVTCFTQWPAQFLVEFDQRAGYTQADSACLS